MNLGHASRDRHDLVAVHTHTATLEGDLAVPPDPRGLVLFANGAAASRHSARQRFVAQDLRATSHVATLLIDLVSDEEDATGAAAARRRDVPVLTERLVAATDFLCIDPRTSTLRVGYFGVGSGAAAALVAAAQRPEEVAAVVARGGRLDGAEPWLERVEAPTLFIVGGDDFATLDATRDAATHLSCEHAIATVPGASHLFEEPGALGEVARLASHWYARHLRSRTRPH